ncbi:MAG: putative DNA binding domain-containing protein [Odoribacteraceae bacterium]|jgi:hypothetical protein|nr:putative DNA binding domain-containing protein [Odoribacteraceae bacterium]
MATREIYDTVNGKLQATPFEKLFPSLELEETRQDLCLKWWGRLKEKHVFSLIETWGEELKKEEVTFEEFTALLPLYVRVQEWLLEDSDFLVTYPRESQEEIYAETERRLKEAYAWQEALGLIQEERELEYVLTLLRKLDISGYLYDKERRFLVLLALLRWSPRLIAMPVREFIRMLLFSEQALLPLSVDALLEHRLSLLETKNFPYMQRTEENMAKIEEAMRLVASKLLISKDAHSDVCLRASFFRWVYMLSESHPEIIRDNALNTLLFRNAGAKFTLSDLIHLELPAFVNKVLSYTSISFITDAKTRVFKGRGQLMLKEGSLYLLPENASLALKESEVQGAVALPLKLLSSKDDDFSAKANVEALASAWERVFQEFSLLQKKRVVTKERPQMGVKVKIQVKNLHPTNPLLAFVRIVDDHFEGEGILHVRQITRIKLISLEQILKPGDRMTATVIESTPEKLSFSIIDELDAIVGMRLHAGELTNALLLARRDNLLTWLSEDGYSLYTFPNPNQEIEVGECRLLELVNVSSNGYIKASVRDLSDAYIDVHESVANLLDNYIDEEEEEFREQQEEKVDAFVDPPFLLPPAYVAELIHVLGLYVSPRLSPRNLNLLYTIKLMAYIAQDPVAEEFYGGQIDYMLAINEFVSGNEGGKMAFFSDTASVEAFVAKFPVLASRMEIPRLLLVGADDSSCDHLAAFFRSADLLVAHLAKLIVSYNLLRPVVPPVAARVRDEILASLAELPDAPKEEEVTSVTFGTENHNREFKTSIIFPPESTGEADMERQLDVILRTITGFLNADGGTLYIGVNDFGVPSGIQADLSYLHANEDKYQLLLRQRIVESLGKDVNGLLEFRFVNYGKRTVCAVAVPSYHQAVAYKSIVWQRQGNATRPMQKGDLKLLKMRKKEAKILSRASVPSFPGEEGYEVKTPVLSSASIPVPSALTEEKPKIATSLLQGNTREGAVAYFTFLKQGRYMLSGEFSRHDDSLLSIAFPEEKDSYLLQVYDTGHANRVDAFSLLSKRREFEYQNGNFANASLIFAAFVQPDDYLLFKILANKDEYIKLVPVQHIKIGTDLALKGTALITAKFDRIVQVEILTASRAEKLACREEGSPLGCSTRSLSVVKDMIYLDELFRSVKK